MGAALARLGRARWKTIAGLVVSGVSLYIVVRNLQPAEILRALRHAQYLWIAPAVSLYLFALLVRTVRWQALLSSERRIAIGELLPTMAMGRGANNIYPFRTGEIVRVLLLSRRNGISIAVGLASILVERIFDGLTMVLFLVLAALIGGIPDYLRYAVWVALAVCGVALAAVYGAVLWPLAVRRLAEWLTVRLVPRRLRPRVLDIAARFIGGFSSIGSVFALTVILLLSLGVWTAETLSYRLLMNAFGFGVSLHQLLLMSGAANLGTALPSGPGNVGTFDAPAVEVLKRVGISPDTAFSYQALLHAVLWCTETLAGLWFMWRAGLHRSDFSSPVAQRAAEFQEEPVH